MRVLIVASYNNGKYAPFIVEQAEALIDNGVEVSYFGVEGKGAKGYLKALPALKRKIRSFKPDIIHAHYGLSGLFANLQRRIPVVTTYHGSDINQKSVLPFSKASILLSKHNIFVSQKTLDIAKPKRKYSLLPCGIDITELHSTTKAQARSALNLSPGEKYILFAGAFDNYVKNSPLAKEASSRIPGATLLEFKGFSRNQATLLMCAADCLLMTSHTEGSPQVIKEAMACGCPIVSVDVGDVKEITSGVQGCYIAPRSAEALAKCIVNALEFNLKTRGIERIVERGLTNDNVAKSLIAIYTSIM